MDDIATVIIHHGGAMTAPGDRRSGQRDDPGPAPDHGRDLQQLRVFGTDLAAQITHMEGVWDVTSDMPEAPEGHGASNAHRLSLLVDIGGDAPVRVDLSLAVPGHEDRRR